MNWSKTKSIFIICFLLLDAFLIFELYLRQQDEGMEGPAGSTTGTNSFRIETELPSTPQDVTFLRGTRTDFSKEKENVTNLVNPTGATVRQKVGIEDDGMQLHSTFDQPVKAQSNGIELQKRLLNLVYQGQNYTYWQSNKETGTMDYAQLYDGRPVFISKRSNVQMLEFTVTDNQITGYRQSYFTFKKSNTVDVISAARAISNLGNSTDLLDNEQPRITGIELGYVNLVGDAGSDPLIFIPAWSIHVKTKQGTSEYFINAVSGNLQSIE
ncbi:two-component system regulatory protein YycI [Sporolactobacillus sp. Y61]|jgi:regulatory protein YycI of two-component signal transduction system YycFG|uniref:Two-component system regulatory protein YycI n=1 Tax=Sporolactobacillus sp. Y61 TaxID=3160863 RepID=A0AAU8IHL3_9BACL|nr:two-component system regulatory protein YycI [Sporolactobacillus sp. THM19-2]RYL94149.1 hypothetical protein EWH91_03115 [Sporolactobacillus sp. THM19-2]